MAIATGVACSFGRGLLHRLPISCTIVPTWTKRRICPLAHAPAAGDGVSPASSRVRTSLAFGSRSRTRSVGDGCRFLGDHTADDVWSGRARTTGAVDDSQGDTTERHAYDPLKAGTRDADEEDSGRIDPGGRGEGMRSVAPWCTWLDLPCSR